MIQSGVEIKSWSEQTPSVEQVRPCSCVRCHAASKPIGRPLQLVGHGLRERQVLGPLQPGQAPAAIVVLVRRFLCLVCGAAMTVVPRGVIGSRLYSASAIVLSLMLWAIRGLPSSAVRRQVCPWHFVAETRHWAMPRRWSQAVRGATLFADHIRRAPSGWTHRQVAARLVTSVLAARHPGIGSICGDMAVAR